MQIKELPQTERPRERLMKYGAQALSTAELLAIVLRTGVHNESSVALSQRLLKRYSLAQLSREEVRSLQKSKGIGVAKACQLVACFELARRCAVPRNTHTSISCAADVAELVIPELQHLKKEHVIGVYVDARQRIIRKKALFIGSLDANIIHPREIFKVALQESAAGVILVHNHPSGDPTPSDADIQVTQQLVCAGEFLGIPFLDHVIIGGSTFVSLREQGAI